MALNGSAASGPILIGFAEALAAPEAALSLLSAGLPVAAFSRVGARPALRRHPHVAIHPIAAPERDAAAAVRDLCEHARALGAVALMPLDDPAVWLCQRAAEELGLTVIGATGAQAELALDKRQQLELARRAGLPVPETQIFERAEDALAIEHFPVVLKPALALAEEAGRLSKGPAHVCADRAELERAVAGWRTAGSILAQPWITGTGEGLFGITVDGEARLWSAHRRLRMVNPQGSGSSACVSIAPDPELVDAATRMMRDAGWDGLFMLELLRDGDGVPWFMELNGRTWGSLALARRLGLEYPLWAARDRLGISEPPAEAAPPPAGVVCRHLGREIVHTLSVMRGPRSAALVDWPSRWSTLRAVARVGRGERWYNWSARHPSVFLDDTFQTVLGAIPRRGRR